MHTFKQIIDNYQTIFLDIWGVLLDGQQRFPRTLELLHLLEGKTVCLMSNTTYTTERMERLLTQLEIMPSSYKHLITAGSLLPHLLEEKNVRGCFYYLGEEDTTEIIPQCYQRVRDISQAHFMIINGAINTDVEPILDYAATHNIPAFCPNPDMGIDDLHGNRHYCAGHMAKRYEEYSGAVHYIGKPHRTIYEKLIYILDTYHADKTLIIGDTLETDIQGAQRMGIDSLLVNCPYDPEKDHIHPTYHIPQLTR